MTQRKGGYRRKSRKLMRKNVSERGKISITRFIMEYKPGEHVVLKAEPAYHKGLFHLRFYGRNGVVLAKRGRCYEVGVYDGSRQKVLIVHPVHLRRLA